MFTKHWSFAFFPSGEENIRDVSGMSFSNQRKVPASQRFGARDNGNGVGSLRVDSERLSWTDRPTEEKG